MSLSWIHELALLLAATVFETMSRLLQGIRAVILAFLVWFELKTGLVLASFALYDKHPHRILTLFIALGLYALCKLVYSFQRRRRIPPLREPFSTSPYAHLRERASKFPPGMEFDKVQEDWEKWGMEPPFVKRRYFGAGRPAEVPPVRRALFNFPTTTLPPSQSDKLPVSAMFGKPGWG